jgi:uncharacterized membrane protein YphA (DoxX/SURF4 family)
MKINTAYAIAIPRIGLSFIFLWFGFQQLTDANSWIGYLPEFVIKYSPISPATFIHFNGAFELVFAMALMCGICTRLSALLLGLHLAHITALMGINPVGVRDFGIVMGVLGVFFYGPDNLCLDMIHFSKEELDIKSIPPKNIIGQNNI